MDRKIYTGVRRGSCKNKTYNNVCARAEWLISHLGKLQAVSRLRADLDIRGILRSPLRGQFLSCAVVISGCTVFGPVSYTHLDVYKRQP